MFRFAFGRWQVGWLSLGWGWVGLIRLGWVELGRVG